VEGVPFFLLVFSPIYFMFRRREIDTHTHTQVEGFFMINQYHMALINDNDFGLEGKNWTLNPKP